MEQNKQIDIGNYAHIRSAEGARTLPNKYYVSEDIYNLENEKIFQSRWLYVCRESKLRSPGSYFLFEIEKESIIILRDRRKKVRAFYNVCRHRGTRLCTEPEGEFSKSIQCPYHAWTYGLDGKLIGAPNMHEIENFNKKDYPLHRVALEIWEGCIFINLSDNPKPFRKAFAPIYKKFKRWQLSKLEIDHSLLYEVNANWKLILQNYSECYHCPTLHPQLNRLTNFRDSANDLEEGPFLGGPMRMIKSGGSMTMSGNRCAMPLSGVSGEDLNRVYYYVIFPNMLLSLQPDYVLIHRILPLGTSKSTVICDWLFHPDAMTDSKFNPSDAIEFWNMTNKQDWEVCESAQKGIASKVYIPGPYSEFESMIAALDREYLKALDN